MRRKHIMAVARTQDTDARCINPKYGRIAKRQGAKKIRQMLKKETHRLERLEAKEEIKKQFEEQESE